MLVLLRWLMHVCGRAVQGMRGRGQASHVAVWMSIWVTGTPQHFLQVLGAPHCALRLMLKHTCSASRGDARAALGDEQGPGSKRVAHADAALEQQQLRLPLGSRDWRVGRQQAGWLAYEEELEGAERPPKKRFVKPQRPTLVPVVSPGAATGLKLVETGLFRHAFAYANDVQMQKGQGVKP